MSISAAVLLLNAVSGAAAADITPVSLAVEARVVDLGDASYDWNRQQRGTGLNLADNTATCDTVTGKTNNGKDTVPDCRFD
jgi:opacity protein-like surface antigen